MTNNISYYISSYFSNELGNIKEVSLNTKKTYRDAIIQLLTFVSMNNKKIENLKIEDFNEKVINNFITSLRKEKGLSEKTCNVKLAAIQGLFKYIRHKNVAYIDLCNQILNIKYKKFQQPLIEWLSIEEITKLFQSFNLKDKNEYKHFMILTVLYETASRIQELCDLKVKDINFNSNSIKLLGKGNKIRIVPVNKTLIKNIEDYKNIQELNENDYLFTNKYGNKLTRVGTQYIIDKYINRIRKTETNLFKIKITNHTFRHSKAVHMLEAGVNIVYIRDILGHTSITITENYAKCSLELKKRELEKNYKTIQENVSYTENQKCDLIKWLKEIT